MNAAATSAISSSQDLTVRVQGTGEDTLYFMLHRMEGITEDVIDDVEPNLLISKPQHL